MPFEKFVDYNDDDDAAATLINEVQFLLEKKEGKSKN